MIVILRLLRKKNYFLKSRIFFFLRKIYGIGFLRSRRLTLLFGVNKYFNTKLFKTPRNNFFFIRVQRKLFRLKFLLDFELRQRRNCRLSLLQNYKTYKGIRFYYGLPVRGQRTHTNAATPKKFIFIASSKRKKYASKFSSLKLKKGGFNNIKNTKSITLVKSKFTKK